MALVITLARLEDGRAEARVKDDVLGVFEPQALLAGQPVRFESEADEAQAPN